MNDADENNNELNLIPLTPKEEVWRAEIYQALNVTNNNYSFSSTSEDGERY